MANFINCKLSEELLKDDTIGDNYYRTLPGQAGFTVNRLFVQRRSFRNHLNEQVDDFPRFDKKRFESFVGAAYVFSEFDFKSNFVVVHCGEIHAQVREH